jgi:hypothetical protein
LFILIALWGGSIVTGPEFFLGVGILAALFLGFGLLVNWLYLSNCPKIS